jgi:hypothetical protein
MGRQDGPQDSFLNPAKTILDRGSPHLTLKSHLFRPALINTFKPGWRKIQHLDTLIRGDMR